MIKFFKPVYAWAVGITSAIFTITPESVFINHKLPLDIADDVNLVLTRIAFFVGIFILFSLGNLVYLPCRRKVNIKGGNYHIQIKYGNLLRASKGKTIIPFDECFTTNVGKEPGDINPDSICGQYLKEHPIQDMKVLLDQAHLHPASGVSKFQGKTKYISGKLVPNENYLLMSFAKLDEDGLGIMTRQEFLDCLSTLWEEIDKYYGQQDINMPIIGSGVTRLNDLTQQELLDIIVESYKLSARKIKTPCKLRIICKRRENFSLNKIGTTL